MGRRRGVHCDGGLRWLNLVRGQVGDRAQLLAGIEQQAFVDIDSLLRPVYGHAKHGASYGHTKIAGKQVLRKGLSPLATTISTEHSAPVIAGMLGCAPVGPAVTSTTLGVGDPALISGSCTTPGSASGSKPWPRSRRWRAGWSGSSSSPGRIRCGRAGTPASRHGCRSRSRHAKVIAPRNSRVCAKPARAQHPIMRNSASEDPGRRGDGLVVRHVAQVLRHIPAVSERSAS